MALISMLSRWSSYVLTGSNVLILFPKLLWGLSENWLVKVLFLGRGGVFAVVYWFRFATDGTGGYHYPPLPVESIRPALRGYWTGDPDLALVHLLCARSYIAGLRSCTLPPLGMIWCTSSSITPLNCWECLASCLISCWFISSVSLALKRRTSFVDWSAAFFFNSS